MKSCRFEKNVEQWFDGESDDAGAVEHHLTQCTACAEYVQILRYTREGALAMAGSRPRISDTQWPSFVSGIREEIETQQNRYNRGWWAMLSLVSASLVVATSVFYMITGPQKPAVAETTIESYSTEIDGATTQSFYTDNGTATVWVNLPEGDMW